MVAILVSQNNETAAMLVSQSSPVGVELSFLMQTLSFVPINLHRCWQSEWKRSILLKSDLKTRRSRFFKTDFKVFGFRKNTFSKTHKMNHYLSTFFARHARNSLRPHHTLENIIHDSNTTCSIMFSSSFHQCFWKKKEVTTGTLRMCFVRLPNPLPQGEKHPSTIKNNQRCWGTFVDPRGIRYPN